MTETGKLAAIVSAHSSGELYAEEFAARGWKCVHVQSVPEISPDFKAGFRPQDFVANVIFDGDMEHLVAALREYPIQVALPGTDEGVALADALADRLHLPGNSLRLSEARRDKGVMGEAIGRAGLRTARQLRTTDLPKLRAWVASGPGFPVVIKPTESGGSDRVALCESDVEMERAFRAIVDSPVVPAVAKLEVLAQERLRGTEYVVDTVSWGGRRCVTDIWRYDKRPANGAAFVYHAAELVPFEGKEQRQLIDYTFRVLDALGHQYGPAHTEVMFTQSGPVLVETASRPHGGHAPAICRPCVGFGQIDLTADACIDPARFERRVGAPYPLERHCTIAFLISRHTGRLRDFARLAEIRALRSFCDLSMRLKPGELLRKTVDLFSSPGVVVLMHADPAVVDADYRRIRELEDTGLYDIEEKS